MLPGTLASRQARFRELRTISSSSASASIDCKKVFCKLACGRYKSNPFDEEVVDKGRSIWREELSTVTPSKNSWPPPPARQPLYLHELGDHARAAGDPDHAVIDTYKHSFCTGIRVGVGCKLPRAPAVFERKVKWASYDDQAGDPMGKDNYISATLAKDALTKQFEAEEVEGKMIVVTDEVAEKEFPNALRRVALAALENPTLPPVASTMPPWGGGQPANGTTRSS